MDDEQLDLLCQSASLKHDLLPSCLMDRRSGAHYQWTSIGQTTMTRRWFVDNSQFTEEDTGTHPHRHFKLVLPL